ncbi:LysM peptidoglycan-binding domain-containing protein, partial [Deinococcus pimensis]|uniref:LysM peptidoglycan-binding domain-containing protein n=1 Tax=Deinococcus pimensis TaxID=309888 RepID=UPI000484B275
MKTFRALLLALGLFGAVSGALAETYTVKAGDTLYKVARTHNMDPVDLMKLNNLSSSTVQVGQVLKVDGEAAPAKGAPTTATTVAPARPPVAAPVA